MPEPFFSVIMPVYNAASTVGAALDSLRMQSCDDFEIIAVDDGSTDASAALLARRAMSEPRLRVIRQPNAGVSAARNRAAQAARGEVLAFLDADDLWAATKLEKHRAQFEADPTLGVAYAQIRFLCPSGAPTAVTSNRPTSGLTPLDLLAENIACTTSNLLARRAAFERVGGFNDALDFDEDKEWLFRAFTAGERFAGLNEALTGYRTSAGGLASDLAQSWRDWKRYVEIARPLDPAGVGAAERLAGAIFLRNMARRALRLGAPPRDALGFMLRALRRDWRVLTVEPRRALMVAGAALAASLLPRRFMQGLATLLEAAPSKFSTIKGLEK